jgi:hypothetical protein
MRGVCINQGFKCPIVLASAIGSINTNYVSAACNGLHIVTALFGYVVTRLSQVLLTILLAKSS